jgi:type II secretory pathway component PulM
MKRHQKLLAWGGAVIVLLAVFALYTRPDFLVTLSNQIWACF